MADDRIDLDREILDRGQIEMHLALIGAVIADAGDRALVEQGIAVGVDERESWRAAFALTVSLVWIYTNLLRILAFFQSD